MPQTKRLKTTNRDEWQARPRLLMFRKACWPFTSSLKVCALHSSISFFSITPHTHTPHTQAIHRGTWRPTNNTSEVCSLSSGFTFRQSWQSVYLCLFPSVHPPTRRTVPRLVPRSHFSSSVPLSNSRMVPQPISVFRSNSVLQHISGT